MVRQDVHATATRTGTSLEDSWCHRNRSEPTPGRLDNDRPEPTGSGRENYFRQLFGFEKTSLTSWETCVRLLCRPSDPAALGIHRFLFGLLMALDVVEERGLAVADTRWGNEKHCRFPLFNFLRPLPLQWMYVVYLVMLAGACGIMLGLKMRLSSGLFLASYWYVLFLDKTSWNNHSYLFGVLAFLFAISDANRFWSVDGLLDAKINNAHVPLWNYALLRAQIFIVYFIAGLKKLDMDWISGYPMQSLASHWVFEPFKTILTDPQIDLYLVHLGGLIIDLFIGFFLFLDKTRTLAIIVSTSFHLMNSQIFKIGMFPYAMMVTQFFFCDMSWPRRYLKVIPPMLRPSSLEDGDIQQNLHCIYTKEDVKPETPNAKTSMMRKALPTSSTWKHEFASMFTMTFIAWQLFLPYSHGITKGYNNWTNGLYGYSWDMMIHSWSVQHIRVTYYDKETGQSGYLDPMVFTQDRHRWSSHGDMIKQYAHCIADNLKNYHINNVSIYFDIWRSLNYRFQQRMVDPRIDILTAEWSPFRKSPWLMPLMVDLSDWRRRLNEIQSTLSNETHTDVVFVSDFPGMCLENYVQNDFGNTTITVLAGKVTVELMEEKKNVTLGPEQSLQVAADTFHNVHTISETASCYMYVFVNTTEAALLERYKQFEQDYHQLGSLNKTLEKYQHDPNLAQYQEMLSAKQAERNEAKLTIWQHLTIFFSSKLKGFFRSIHLSTGALYCLATNSSFSDFLNATYQWEAKQKLTQH